MGTKVLYEITCKCCDAEYEITFDDEWNSGKNSPELCPFCGEPVDIEVLDEESDYGKDYDDYEEVYKSGFDLEDDGSEHY